MGEKETLLKKAVTVRISSKEVFFLFEALPWKFSGWVEVV